MSDPIWEHGDEALRPTRNPWKCLKCGTELYTRDLIEGHKERHRREQEKMIKKKVQKIIKLEHDLRKKMRKS